MGPEFHVNCNTPGSQLKIMHMSFNLKFPKGKNNDYILGKVAKNNNMLHDFVKVMVRTTVYMYKVIR